MGPKDLEVVVHDTVDPMARQSMNALRTGSNRSGPCVTCDGLSHREALDFGSKR